MLILVAGTALLAVAAGRVWLLEPADGSRAALDAVEAGVFAATTCLVTMAWIAVALATAGEFSGVAFGAGCATAAGVLFVTAGPSVARAGRPRLGRCEIGVLAVLASSAIAYARPHEYVLGGADAGTYMNVAATIARTGSLVVHDDWVALAAAHENESLRPSPRHMKTRRIQFVGWFVDDADASRVLPQFLPLHPSLAAVAIAAGGLRAGLYVAPACALLGLAAVFCLARRLFGSPAALLATAILAATPTQLFFARYPTAEPLGFALLFAGLAAYQHLRDGERRSLALGVLGGACFGAAALARIDLPIVLALVVAALALEWRAGTWARGFTAFAIALAALLCHAALHGALLAWPYVWNVFEGPVRALAGTAERHPYATCAAGAAALGAAALVATRRIRLPHTATRPASTTRTALALAVVAASLYAYFVRPALHGGGIETTWPSGNQYPILDAENWVRVGWYLTPLGLALATAGLAVLARGADLSRAGLFLAIGASTTIQYVTRVMTTPYHIYAMRRFVPIALPALAIFAAVAVATLARNRRLPRAKLVAGLLGAALVGAILWQARFAAADRDLGGAIDWLHALDSRIRPGAVLLVSEPSTALFADTFGPPLRYVFGHPVVPLRRGRLPVLALVDDVLARAAAEGRPVQLLAAEPIALVLRRHLDLRPVGTVPVRLSMLMNTYDGFPSTRQTAHYGVEIYDVAGRAAATPPDPDVLVDVGTMDATFLRSGFHYKEVLGDGTTARWTDGDASLEVPLETRGPVDVAIRARIFDAPPGGAPLVRVLFDDRRIGSFRPEDRWQVFHFTVMPRPYEGRSRLRLTSPSFRPSQAGSSDTRDLGVFVDWVRVTER